MDKTIDDELTEDDIIFNAYEINKGRIQADWKGIFKILKRKGFTHREISEYIGTRFDKNLYRADSMNISSFSKLTQLIRINLLPREDSTRLFTGITCKQKFHTISRKSQEKLAEFVGIVLGDGHLDKNQFSISLDYHYPKYYTYCLKLVMEVLKVAPDKISNYGGTYNILYSRLQKTEKKTRELIERLGIKKGNKIKNQVSVPRWIYNDPVYSIRSIKGLFDTDGCIYFQKRKQGIGYISLNFTNKSKPLLDFFKNFSDIHQLGGKYDLRNYRVQIQNRRGVYQFAKIVNSEKISDFLERNSLVMKDIMSSHKFEIRSFKKSHKYVKANWVEVFENFNEMGYSINDLRNLLGTNFSNLVDRGDNLRFEYFKQLETLLGQEIDHEIVIRNSYHAKQM